MLDDVDVLGPLFEAEAEEAELVLGVALGGIVPEEEEDVEGVELLEVAADVVGGCLAVVDRLAQTR